MIGRREHCSSRELFGETTSTQSKERIESHIVIHDNIDGIAEYPQFDDLDRAVAFVEELRNTADVKDAKLYALSEVAFEMKPYFKVEVVNAAPAPPPAAFETAQPEAVTCVDASPEPVETFVRDTTPVVGFDAPEIESVPSFGEPLMQSSGRRLAAVSSADSPFGAAHRPRAGWFS